MKNAIKNQSIYGYSLVFFYEFSVSKNEQILPGHYIQLPSSFKDIGILAPCRLQDPQQNCTSFHEHMPPQPTDSP